MKDGQIVEQGPTSTVMNTPKEDYTKSLLAAAPQPPTRRQSV
jgi:peptide/nickel transport system ATP-binding protein